MSTPHTFRRSVYTIILSGSLGMMTFVGVGAVHAGEGSKRDATNAAKMVDAIVNRNKQPKVVERSKGWPMIVAVFPESYDWKEEDRVRTALGKLLEDTSVEVWEELVRRGDKDDSKYCVVSVTRQAESADVWSVDAICGVCAYSRLTGVYRQHMPNDPRMEGWPLQVNIGIKNLADWRKERKDKPLYQLQIEVCEKAIVELSRVKGLSKDEKATAQKKIEAEIEQLKKSKQPIFWKDDYLFPDWLTLYKRDYAKKIREAVKSGSDADLSIQK
jgi:hypothetical protein